MFFHVDIDLRHLRQNRATSVSISASSFNFLATTTLLQPCQGMLITGRRFYVARDNLSRSRIFTYHKQTYFMAEVRELIYFSLICEILNFWRFECVCWYVQQEVLREHTFCKNKLSNTYRNICSACAVFLLILTL